MNLPTRLWSGFPVLYMGDGAPTSPTLVEGAWNRIPGRGGGFYNQLYLAVRARALRETDIAPRGAP